MLPLNHLNTGAPFMWNGGQTMDPIAVPLPHAPAVTGLSRSAIYREAAKGNLRLFKLGRSTMLCMASARAFLASLPAAQIGAKQAA